MRKLKTRDILSACRCLKALGVKAEVREIAQKSEGAQDAWNMGFELLWNVFDRATETEGERYLYEFLAGPFEMTAAEVADLEISALIDLLRQLAKENDLTRFFRAAGASMK